MAGDGYQPGQEPTTSRGAHVPRQYAARTTREDAVVVAASDSHVHCALCMGIMCGGCAWRICMAVSDSHVHGGCALYMRIVHAHRGPPARLGCPVRPHGCPGQTEGGQSASWRVEMRSELEPPNWSHFYPRRILGTSRIRILIQRVEMAISTLCIPTRR